MEANDKGRGTVQNKNTDKVLQSGNRKSTSTFSLYKNSNLVRPGFSNKSSKSKGYDQFQGKTMNILEEMQLLVRAEIQHKKLLKSQQLARIAHDFEESLKQVIYERLRGTDSTSTFNKLDQHDDE